MDWDYDNIENDAAEALAAEAIAAAEAVMAQALALMAQEDAADDKVSTRTDRPASHAETARLLDPLERLTPEELDDTEDHIAEAMASAAIRDAMTIVRAALSMEP